MVGVARRHQRADTLKQYSQKTSQSNHTRTTAFSSSMKLSHALWGHPRWAGHGGEVWHNVVHWEGNGTSLQYSCLENPMNSMKRQNDGILVRKHLTGGLLCAVLDLSGILCSLLIPERGEASLSQYWGIQAFPSLVLLYGDKHSLPSCEPYGNSDCLQLSLSLIWIAYVL